MQKSKKIKVGLQQKKSIRYALEKLSLVRRAGEVV